MNNREKMRVLLQSPRSTTSSHHQQQNSSMSTSSYSFFNAQQHINQKLTYLIIVTVVIVFVLVGNFESIMKTSVSDRSTKIHSNNNNNNNEIIINDNSMILNNDIDDTNVVDDDDDDDVTTTHNNNNKEEEEEEGENLSSRNNNNNNDNNNNNNKLKSAIAVGNGASLRNSGFGRQVNKNDVVLRFNLFKTVGFETDVGSKTTHWVMSTIKDPNDFDREEIPNLKQSLEHVYIPFVFRDCSNANEVTCPRLRSKIPKQNIRIHELKQIMRTWLNQNGMDDVKIHSDEAPNLNTLYDEYNLNEKFPSMGLMFLNFAWRKFKQPVEFAGFDFYSGSHDHYWERKLKNETCHNMNDESRVLSQFVKEKKLKALDLKAQQVLASFVPKGDEAYDPRCKIVCNQNLNDLFCLTLRGKEVDVYMANPEKWEHSHGIVSAYSKKMKAKEVKSKGSKKGLRKLSL
jgi:hypothetical protein